MFLSRLSFTTSHQGFATHQPLSFIELAMGFLFPSGGSGTDSKDQLAYALK